MTDKPSIKSLRAALANLTEPKEWGDDQEGSRNLLAWAITRLESLRAENEAMKAERDSAIRQAKAVGDALMAVSAERDAERARADALAARVEALSRGPREADSVLGFYRDRAADEEGGPMPELAEKAQGIIQPLLESTPAADLEALKARAEAAESAARRVYREGPLLW